MKKRQNQTLLQLAMNGPMNVYQVWRSIPGTNRGSRSSYQKAVNSLLKIGFIKVKESKPWYGGRSEKAYQLAIEGFLQVLREKEAQQNIDKIINSNKEILPEYLGLWDGFKQFEVREVAMKLLEYAVRRLQQGLPSFPERIQNRKPTVGDWLARLAIFPYDALLEGVLNQEEAERWQQMLISAPKAEELYLSTLKWMVESHKSAMESFSRALTTHNQLKYWSESTRQIVEIIEKIQDPTERLRALQQNRDLWQAVLQLYPETKDEKELSALLQKLKTGKSQPL
jgi:predicted transcriptional regulator